MRSKTQNMSNIPYLPATLTFHPTCCQSWYVLNHSRVGFLQRWDIKPWAYHSKWKAFDHTRYHWEMSKSHTWPPFHWYPCIVQPHYSLLARRSSCLSALLQFWRCLPRGSRTLAQWHLPGTVYIDHHLSPASKGILARCWKDLADALRAYEVAWVEICSLGLTVRFGRARTIR